MYRYRPAALDENVLDDHSAISVSELKESTNTFGKKSPSMAEIKFSLGVAAESHDRNLSQQAIIDNRFTTPKKINSNSYSSVKLGILGVKG